jgi:hypothetical protein
MFNMDTTVEKLGHAFHMQEIWTKASPLYLQLKESEPGSMKEVCTKD